jgi:hypothetical protein
MKKQKNFCSRNLNYLPTYKKNGCENLDFAKELYRIQGSRKLTVREVNLQEKEMAMNKLVQLFNK